MHKLKPMPDAEKLKASLKPAFIERYEKITDFEKFCKYSFSYLRRSIRTNTLKIKPEKLKQRLQKLGWQLTPVKWDSNTFFVEHKEGRRDIGNTIEHSLGYFYVQEAVSILPPLVLQPKPGEIVLDMCASPGSKTTQMASMMKNKGVLVANDHQGIRLKPLGTNLQRCGVLNTITSLKSGERIKGVEFDKILADVPCSSTGAIRKSLKTINMWNPTMLKNLSRTQKKLIDNAFNLLKTGGTMVYSTCSIDPQENEEVVSYLLEKYPNAKCVKFKIPNLKTTPAITEFEGKTYHPQVKNSLRLWPQDNDTEGFFVAKIKKE